MIKALTTTSMVDKIDRPQTDPAFAPAHAAFTRWQSEMIQSIGSNGMPGTAVARAQFLHDSTVNFMAWGRNGGDWDKALNAVTDIHSPSSFVKMLTVYKQAAMKPNAAQWLQQRWPQFGSTGSVTWPTGTPAGASAPKVQPKKIDQKAVDQIRGL